MATRKLELLIVADEKKYRSAINRAVTETTKLTRAQQRSAGSAAKMGARSAAGAKKASASYRAMGTAVSSVKGFLKQAAAAAVGFISAQAAIAVITRAWSALKNAVLGFDTAMRNVNSLLGLSEQGIAKMGDAVLDLTKRLPQSASELSEGLYDIVSSGFAGTQALSVLDAAATAASAGLSSTAVAGKGISAVLNAYGLSAAHAAEVSDTLFQTVNLGVITFDELAGSVGDFVGTAAVLGVNIDDASAALATMTLSGINAAEASTALNRVMLGLIKPSAQMATILDSWGFASGVAAVETLGLQGVMDRLRTETGGTAEAMAGLFPEVRGLKGALALTAVEGKNYARVTEQMGEAHDGAGASAKVLAEQAKSLQFQIDLVKNAVMAAGITAGRWLGPKIASGMSALRDVAGKTASALSSLWQIAQPGVEDLGDAFGDLVAIAADLGDALGPTVAVFAALAAGSVVALFRGLARAVSTTTGFLRDHSFIVAALAVLYAARLAPSIAAALQGFVALRRAQVANMLLGARKAAAGLSLAFASVAFQAKGLGVVAGGLAAMKAGVVGVATALGPWGIALAAVAAATFAIMRDNAQMNREAKENAEGITRGLDLTSFAGISKALSRGNDELERLERGAAAANGGWRQLTLTMENIQFDKDIKAATKEIAIADKARDNLERNLRRVASGVGLRGAGTGEARNLFRPIIDTLDSSGRIINSKLSKQAARFEKFGRSMGEDLTQDALKGVEAATRVAERLTVLGAAAGYSEEQIASMSAAGLQNAEVLQAQAEEAAAMEKAVTDAFGKVGDVVGKLGKVEDLSAVGIGMFYANALTQTNTFLANIEEAYRQGFDPELIARILVAGPEEAGQLLQTLVGEHSQAFVEMVNAAESAMSEASQRALEITRLQGRAMRAESDTMAALLPDAIRVANEKVVQGASATTESIAAALQLTPSQVIEIAESYSIELPGPIVSVKVDTLVAETSLKELRAAIEAVPELVTTKPNVDDPESVKVWWDGLKEKLMGIPGLRDTVAKITDPQQAHAWWVGLQERIANVPDDKTTLADVNDQASGVLDAIRFRIASLKDKTITVGLNVVQRRNLSASLAAAVDAGRVTFVPQADGGILRFGDGGQYRRPERHVAQIAPAGANRLWAEPETGGEAYIPLAPGKRARSARVLLDVAKEFGMLADQRTPIAPTLVSQHVHYDGWSLSGSNADEVALAAMRRLAIERAAHPVVV